MAKQHLATQQIWIKLGHLDDFLHLWDPWKVLCFHPAPRDLWRCGKLWQSTLGRCSISQARPGSAVITNTLHISWWPLNNRRCSYCLYHVTLLVCPGWAPHQDEAGWASPSWMPLVTMTEGRKALESLTLAVKFSGLEVTHITSGHSPLTPCPIQPPGARKCKPSMCSEGRRLELFGE